MSTIAERLEARAARMDNAGDGLQYYSKGDAALDREAATALRDPAPNRVEITKNLIAAGAALSNAAYNLAQRKHLTDDERRSLKEAYEAWDLARRHYHHEAALVPGRQEEPVGWRVTSSNHPPQYFELEGEAEQWGNSPGIFDTKIVALYAHPQAGGEASLSVKVDPRTVDLCIEAARSSLDPSKFVLSGPAGVITQAINAMRALSASPSPSKNQVTEDGPRHVIIEHDGFSGDVIGRYETREGKKGIVVQQDGTRVVHVYRADRAASSDRRA